VLDRLEERMSPAADLLVTTAGSYPQQFLKELTPAGALVRQLTVPPPLGSSGDTTRDVVADPAGNLYVYNGTFTPSLATWSPSTSQWAQQNYPGWGTINNVSYGGLGIFQNYVFASDMTVAGDPAGASNGVVRFTVPGGPATRFAQGTDFIDVNVGLNGKVYALTGTGTVYAFDPVSMALLAQFALPAGHDYRGIAANAAGELFTANWDNSVSHLTPTGGLLATVNLTGPTDGSWFGNPMNLDVAPDGTVAVGTRSGHVVQLTSALTNVSYFGTWTGMVQYPCFVSFTPWGAPPVPSLTVGDVSANEGNSGLTPFTFTATLSAPSGQTVQVYYYTSPGTARAGTDYYSTSGFLTFAPGQTTQTVTVNVVGNTIPEPNKTFYLNLSSPLNVSLARTQAVGTILNDDTAVSVSDIALHEGNTGVTPFTFTLSLSAPSGQWVYVNYATADGTGVAGTDYQAASGLASFAPGQTTQTVTVGVLANAVNQPNRTFFLNLSVPANATIARGQATATIIDDDPATHYTFSQPHATSVDDMAGPGVFTQFSNINTNFTLSVRKFTTFLVPPGTPYDERSVLESDVHTTPVASLASATFTFYESGYTSNSAPVLIYGYVGDGWLSTTDATSPAVLLGSYDPTAGLGLHTVGLDAAGVRSLAGSAGWTGWLGIRLVGPSDTNTQLNSTYAANPPTLDFNLGAPPPLPTVSVNDVTAVEGTSSGVGGGTGTTPFTFTVTLSQPSSGPVTVAYQTADGTARSGYGNNGYVATGGALVFAPGQTQLTVTVPVYADNMWEPNQTFSLQIGAANAAVARGTGTGTILDDDPVPQVGVANTGLPEGNSGISYASFAITLTNPEYQPVTIHYTTVDGTALANRDYVPASGTVTIYPGQTAAYLNVGVIGNKIVEPNKTFYLALTSADTAILPPNTQGSCLIINDDHAPVVSAGGNQTANEGASVAFDASGSTDADGDPLTFTWNFGDSATATGARPTHAYADNGVSTVTVSASDGYNVTTGTLTVTVLNVPPAGAVGGPADAVPGQDRVFTFTATDPSPVDQAAGFTYQINWGDGTTQTVQGPGSGVQVDHVFTAAGPYTVTATATDKDAGTSAAATLAVRVVTAELQGGDLYVGGTTGDDQVTVQPADANGTVDVVVNGVDQGTFVPTGQVVVFGQDQGPGGGRGVHAHLRGGRPRSVRALPRREQASAKPQAEVVRLRFRARPSRPQRPSSPRAFSRARTVSATPSRCGLMRRALRNALRAGLFLRSWR
jgi:hypothetical protein